MRLLHKTLLPLIALFAFSIAAEAKDKKDKTAPRDPQDSIEVLGHVKLPNGPVKRFLTTQHYSSYYLYAEYSTAKNLTLIDVTKANHPAVLADVDSPSGAGSSLFAAAGTAALLTDVQTNDSAQGTQTIRIMDFSDLQHPKVAREFVGVTALSRDERRGLIFLANGEGLWILHQSLALDPEVEKAYANHVLYDR